MAIFLNFCACLRRGRGRQAQTGQAKILILKIRGCIPAVKIFAFPDPCKKFLISGQPPGTSPNHYIFFCIIKGWSFSLAADSHCDYKGTKPADKHY